MAPRQSFNKEISNITFRFNMRNDGKVWVAAELDDNYVYVGTFQPDLKYIPVETDPTPEQFFGYFDYYINKDYPLYCEEKDFATPFMV